MDLFHASAIVTVGNGEKNKILALFLVARGNCWKYALESTGFDPLVGSDGFDPLWCKSPNGPQML
jgi:hypothetical protein